jgi:L-fuconolactonase
MWNRRRFIAASIATSTIRSFAAASTASPLLIDSHVHVWKHDPAFPFTPGAHPPAEDASAETLLELMRANQVARTILIQVIHYRWDNSYLASVLKQYPGKFHGRPLIPAHSNSPPRGTLPQQLPRNHHPLNLARPLANRA